MAIGAWRQSPPATTVNYKYRNQATNFSSLLEAPDPSHVAAELAALNLQIAQIKGWLKKAKSKAFWWIGFALAALVSIKAFGP